MTMAMLRSVNDFVDRNLAKKRLLAYLSASGPTVVWLHGQADVGKTALLNQLPLLAKQAKDKSLRILVAIADGKANDPVKVMNAVAREFQTHGLMEWRKSYRNYEKLRRRVERAPNAPDSVSKSLLSRVIDGVSNMTIPGTGIPAASFLKEEEVQSFKEFLPNVLNQREEKRLDDLSARLTPLFVKELGRVCQAGYRVVLAFDDFEKTEASLGPWLFPLFQTDEFEDLNCLALISSCRPRPNARHYYSEPDYEYRYREEILLSPFPYIPPAPDQNDAWRDYQEITGWLERLTQGPGSPEGLLKRAEGFPGLAQTLARRGTGIKRTVGKILGQIEEKKIARVCSVPRYLDADVFCQLTGEVCAPDDFEKLDRWPFVHEDEEQGEFGGKLVYNPAVRRLVLHFIYRRYKNEYISANEQMRDFHRERFRALGPEAEMSPEWIRMHKEYSYHALAANPRQHLHEALEFLVQCLHDYVHDDEYTLKLIGNLANSFEEIAHIQRERTDFSRPLDNWYRRLDSFIEQYLKEKDGSEDDPQLELLEDLCRYNDQCGQKGTECQGYTVMSSAAKKLAHLVKGILLFEDGDYDAALQDFDTALALDGEFAEPYFWRAFVRAIQGEYPNEVCKLLERAQELERELTKEDIQNLEEKLTQQEHNYWRRLMGVSRFRRIVESVGEF